MPKIRVKEILPFSCEQIYQVVVDVESYPKFLPWCSSARVWDRKENQFMAEMTVSFKGIREKFQTLDIIEPNKKVEINLKSGPFQYLASTWSFSPIGEDRTQVEFFIDFRFSNRMKEMIMGPVFTQVSKQMISAFRKRAIVLYRR
jgi:coenzyme Q-binding protein COQ10